MGKIIILYHAVYFISDQTGKIELFPLHRHLKTRLRLFASHVRVVWYSFASRSKGKLIFSNLFYYGWGGGDTLERKNCLFFDFSFTITKNNTTGATNSKSEDRREINMETCCGFL